MITIEEELELDGHALRRFIFRPDEDQPIRGVAMHFHGQGDFAERYRNFLLPFINQGIACVSTDLTGHGRSEGVRGRVPGFGFVDHLADSNRERCQELWGDVDGPLGILGHSAGGLMALRELLRRPERYSYSWISSPLLRPDANQPRLLVMLAPLAALLVPGLTVGTGVTPEECTSAPDPTREEFHNDPQLFHARVSIGWGHALMKAAAWVSETMITSPPEIPLLITQGLRDPICPPIYLQRLLNDAKISRLRFREFPSALHEPFADEGREEVFSEITAWLTEEVCSGAECGTAVRPSS